MCMTQYEDDFDFVDLDMEYRFGDKRVWVSFYCGPDLEPIVEEIPLSEFVNGCMTIIDKPSNL